jgi:hypothetical protein
MDGAKMAMTTPRNNATATVAIAVGVCLVVGSLLIPMWQAYTWLRYGVWPELSVRAMWLWLGLRLPEIDTLAVATALDWLFDQATGVVFFVGGALLLIIGGDLSR